jgi:hypothetical protein
MAAVEIVGHETLVTADEALLGSGRYRRPFGDGNQDLAYHGHRPQVPGEWPEIGGGHAIEGDLSVHRPRVCGGSPEFGGYIGSRLTTPEGGSPEFGGLFSSIGKAFKSVGKGVASGVTSVAKVTPMGLAYTAATKGTKVAARDLIRVTPIGTTHTLVTKGPKAAIVATPPAQVLKAVSKAAGVKPAAVVSHAQTIAQNPLVRVGAAGAAFVFPPVGIPLSAAVETANAIARSAASVNPKVRLAAAKTVLRTAAAAKKGDQDAARGLKLLASAAKSRATTKGNRRIAFIVTAAGRILRDTPKPL